MTLGKGVSEILVGNKENRSGSDLFFSGETNYLQDSIRFDALYIDTENPYFCSENGILLSKDKTILYDILPSCDITNGVFTIPASVTTIANPIHDSRITAFATESDAFSVIDGVLFDKALQTLVQYPAGRTDSIYTIPSGIITIGQAAFYQTKLNQVIMTDSITTIASGAFAHSNLTFITLPEGLKTVEGCAFLDTDLKNIFFPSSVRKIASGVFWNTSLDWIAFEHDELNLTIASDFESDQDTTTIYYAYESSVISFKFPTHYQNCGTTESGTCGENLTWEYSNFTLKISGSGSMTACGAKKFPWTKFIPKSIVFSGENIQIAPAAFQGIETICNANLSGVTDIGINAFSGCKWLTSITDADGLQWLGDSAFSKTNWLDTEQNHQENIRENGLFYLGHVLLSCPSAATEITIPADTTYVSEYAFSTCSVKTLFVPASGVVYHEKAFFGNTSIAQVRFAETTEELTLSDFRTTENHPEIQVTDAANTVFAGTGVLSSDSLLQLANALCNTPFMDTIREEYYQELQQGMPIGILTDDDMIQYVYDAVRKDTKYGFAYVESKSGTLTDSDGNLWSLQTNLSHADISLMILKIGVCSSYESCIRGFIDYLHQCNSYGSVQVHQQNGYNHTWNIIGLHCGTDCEKWYYMDASNGIYLIGYENPVLSSNAKMFAYDSALVKNENATYTITCPDGTSLDLESTDYTKPEQQSVQCGDTNLDGQIDLCDLVLLNQYHANSVFFSTAQLANSDCNADNMVNQNDAVVLFCFLVRMINSIPYSSTI